MIFFSQNKTPLVFSEGVILNLTGYCGVFFALGLAGFFSAGAAITAGFFTKVRFFFAGTASGVGSGPNFTSGGAGTYGIGVVAAGGSNLYGAWGTAGVVTASRG